MSKSKNWNAHLAVSEVHHLGSDLGLLFAQNIEKYLISLLFGAVLIEFLSTYILEISPLSLFVMNTLASSHLGAA